MIDLQLVRRARPAVDLVYLLGSSTTPEFREGHMEEVLTFYHETLTGLLGKFGYSPELYTYAQLKKDFDECFIFGFVMSTMHSMVTNENMLNIL